MKLSLFSLSEERRHYVRSDAGPTGEPSARELPSAPTDHASPLEAFQPLAIALGEGRPDIGAVDPGNDTLPVGDEDRLAALHTAQVVAQPLPQLGDLDDLHDFWPYVDTNHSHVLAIKSNLGLDASVVHGYAPGAHVATSVDRGGRWSI